VIGAVAGQRALGLWRMRVLPGDAGSMGNARALARGEAVMIR
jgi:hypothetical protein